MIKKRFLAPLALILAISLAGCSQADKVSQNMSLEADNFNVMRRVTIINVRTDKIEFEAIGNISIDAKSDESQLIILAQTGQDEFKKHIIRMTEWNMYVLEDLGGADVNKYKYEINYMPESIIPYTVVEKD